MAYKIPLESNQFYHVYNRGINGCNIFYTSDNYTYFLRKYAQYVSPATDTLAYCLLGNHFHFLIRVKSDEERTQLREKPSAKGDYITLDPSRQFGHLFNAYAQAFNHRYSRTGSLFEEAFERKWIDNDKYLTNLIEYIHKNPVKHGFTNDFENYPHSSFNTYLSTKPTKLLRQESLVYFDGMDKFTKFHAETQDHRCIQDYIIEFD